MNRQVLLVFGLTVIILITILVYTFFFSGPKYLREEYVGGKYECSIGIFGEDPRGYEVGEIRYVKNDVHYKGFYNSYLRDAMDWIKADTSVDAVVMSWWDYGHMIVGYSEREAVIKNPSQEALMSVKDPSYYSEFEPHKKLVDVATALTTTDISETISLMEKYGADYILVTYEDGGGKANWIFHFAGLNFADYMNSTWLQQGHSGYTFNQNMYNDLGKQTTIYKILAIEAIEGLELTYSDENVVVYKIVS